MNSNRYKDTLLIVGDNDSDRKDLCRIFDSRFFLLEAETASQAVMLINQSQAYIAAVICDIPLTQSDEIKAIAGACEGVSGSAIPLISIITPSGTGENEEYAFILGATDVVLKPYATLAILRRVQVLADLQVHQYNLERLVEKQSDSIRKNSQVMIDTLSSVIEYRSSEAGNHVLRIRKFTKILLEELSKIHPEYELSDAVIEMISSASALHDIGKISIPDSILNKPTKLTPEELKVMQSHTTAGSELLENIKLMTDVELVKYIHNIVLYHHERWDGSGYPTGLKGDNIPICAQAVGLADAYDALTTKRVYKPAFSHDTAVNMIVNGECGIFGPKLIECFKRVHGLLADQARLYADGHSLRTEDIRLDLPLPQSTTYALNSLQVSQYKYQTLLHHMGDTVIEMNLDGKIYHVVSNPNPDFVSLFNNVPFDLLPDRIINDTVHPDEVEYAGEQYAVGMANLFIQNNRSYVFRCRMFSPYYNEYFPYEITLQKIVTENADQRMMMIIFHKLVAGAASKISDAGQTLANTPAMHDLVSSVLCCLDDPDMTIREGTSTLTPLIGLKLEDIWKQYNNSLLALTHPDDRELLVSNLKNLDIRSGRKEFVFRLQCTGGEFVWVQCRCRAAVGSDGEEYRYLCLTDVTAIKNAYRDMDIALNRHKILLSLSKNILFDWDFKSGSLFISEKWEERFGRPLNKDQFSQGFLNANFIHPDDLPIVREKISSMSTSSSDAIDLRVSNSEGQYLWSRIRYTITRDLEGRPDHILGIIYDIDELKTEALFLQKQAERDGLTTLLNKSSIQREIKDYLVARKETSLAAMLILDVDNFKAINDTLGHFYGDAVLKQMGTTLKSLFRVNDSIGRIGGDEFIILLKDIPDKAIVSDRCRLLVETFRQQFQKLTPNLPVSISIGAAVAPEDGVTYGDLYRLADEALYSAKRKGKDQFVVYNSRDKFDFITEPGSRVTRIDSDYRVAMDDESLMEFIFNMLYDSRNFNSTVNEILAFVGIQFNVSRVYIFENNDDNSVCSNTFEWCNENIEPQIEVLQNLSYDEDLPGFRDAYNEEGILYSTDITELSDEVRAILEPQGIKSMLHCSIMDEGVTRGFVGFDECTANHLWTQGQVELLKLISKLLSVFITKHRQKEKAQ